MSGPYRMPPDGPKRFGREIDRSEPVGFRFGGRTLSGFYGDTLASALLASGQATIGRSELLGRPWGPMALGIEDHALVRLDGDDGVWADISGGEVAVREGLRAGPAHGAALARFVRGGPAGRRQTLPIAQRLLERLRGVLPLPAPALPAVRALPFASRETCDALVIGAGLAGLAAAAALRSAGLDIRVVEASRRPGGLADLYEGAIDGRPFADWVANQAGALTERGCLALGATAIEIEPDGAVTVIERTDPQRPGVVALRRISAATVVLATGWRERPLLFSGNDRPGVLLATTARALLRRQAVVPGARVLVATTCDEGYRAALDLREAGASVELVLDARDDPQGPMVDMAKALGAPLSLSSVVTGVAFDASKGGLTAVGTRNMHGEGASAGARTFAVDALVVSGGLVARDELSRGCALGPDQGLHMVRCGPNACETMAAGWAAGVAAAAQLGAEPIHAAPAVTAAEDEPAASTAASYGLRDRDGAAEAFVDIGAEVTAADLHDAIARHGGGAAAARRLGIGLGPECGRLSADLPAVLAAELDAVARPPGPSPARPTLGLLAARAGVRD